MKTITHRRIHIALLSLMVVAFALTRDIGLADNGDFTRAMTIFTSIPVGFQTNWQTPGTSEFNRRFSNYWIPYWVLDWPGVANIYSSAVLLWWPGVILSSLIFSPAILSLPIMSLPSLAVLLFCFWKLLQWIRNSDRPIFYLTLAVPFLLVLTNANYLAYINSFFQEGPAFVYLIATLTSLAWFAGSRTWAALITCALLSLLMGTAKQAHFYWPALAMLISSLVASNSRQRLVAIALAIVGTGLSIRFMPTTPELQTDNAGQSIITGVLAVSDDPEARMAEIGISGAEACIGNDIYTPAGGECFNRFKDKMTYANVVRLLLAEPPVAVRLLVSAAATMQETEITGLDHYAEGDVRAGKRLPLPVGLTLWSVVKRVVFPRGVLLLVFLFAVLVWVALRASTIRPEEPLRVLAAVAVAASLGCFAEMAIAVLAGGQVAMDKHLFLANVAFDAAVITFVSIAVKRMADSYIRPPA